MENEVWENFILIYIICSNEKKGSIYLDSLKTLLSQSNTRASKYLAK